jgi:hypothetical protein
MILVDFSETAGKVSNAMELSAWSPLETALDL